MSGLAGFFSKTFSTNALWSRIIRSLLLAGTAYQATENQPTTTRVLTTVMAFCSGMISAGQNNPPPSAPPDQKPVPVAKTA